MDWVCKPAQYISFHFFFFFLTLAIFIFHPAGTLWSGPNPGGSISSAVIHGAGNVKNIWHSCCSLLWSLTLKFTGEETVLFRFLDIRVISCLLLTLFSLYFKQWRSSPLVTPLWKLKVCSFVIWLLAAKNWISIFCRHSVYSSHIYSLVFWGIHEWSLSNQKPLNWSAQ